MTDHSALPILDLTDFREITDGDREIEQALFADFLSSTGASLVKLEKCINAPNATVWSDESHSIKGAAQNLGAMRLAACCADAQAYEGQDQAELLTLLRAMAAAFVDVQKAMKTA